MQTYSEPYLKKLTRAVQVISAIVLFSAGLLAQQNFDNVQITAEDLGNGIFMLTGAGGNIGLSVGDDGAFIIDDQFAPLSDKILAVVKQHSSQPVRFVVNTHWHGDHTGGNENMNKAGAMIVAHQNVRKRMSSEHFNPTFNSTTPPSPAGALPVITFSESITFHWNGQDIEVMHTSNAHTDGDALVHFKSANVIHMGDTFFNGMYPYIDVSSDGNLDGIIATADRVLALADESTKIIPGHGPLADKAALQAYRDVLNEVRTRVKKQIAEGKSQDDVVTARVTRDFDDSWGNGFMKPDTWMVLVYQSLAGE